MVFQLLDRRIRVKLNLFGYYLLHESDSFSANLDFRLLIGTELW